MKDKIYILGIKEIIERKSDLFKISVSEVKAVEIENIESPIFYEEPENKIYNVNVWQKQYGDKIDKIYVAPFDDLTDEYMRMTNDACQRYFYWMGKHNEVLRKLTRLSLLSFLERLKFLFMGKKYSDKITK
jgi:broad specificity polyphosphatase/5'/3'-nucleotidase SurE